MFFDQCQASRPRVQHPVSLALACLLLCLSLLSNSAWSMTTVFAGPQDAGDRSRHAFEAKVGGATAFNTTNRQRILLGERGLEINPSDAQPVEVGPLVVNDQQKVTATDGEADDGFGWDVALSGDTAIISAWQDDHSGTDSGAAYIFIRDDNGWREQAKLTASDASEGDLFGISVDLSGDTALVGASRDDERGRDSGAAYVFVRTGRSWEQQAKLVPTDGEADDEFGHAVALSGDIALIGASWDDDNGENAGAAYVFTRSGGGWSQQNKLIASDAGPSQQFGYAVALSGHLALIGAPLDSVGRYYSGAAYVFTDSGGDWVEQVKLKANDAEPYVEFGTAVALFDDMALVGAPFDDDNGDYSGSAYLFVRNAGGWNQQAKLIASDGAGYDEFGSAVALFGTTALIGAPLSTTDSALESGAAYAFARTETGWAQQAKLTARDAESGDWFAASVALSIDSALIGADWEDDKGFDSGAAYFFALSSEASRYERQVQMMYVAYFGRPGDPAGVDYWTARLAAVGGRWVPNVLDVFAGSPEYIDRFAGLTEETLIDALFLALFNRPADAAGLTYYVDLLNGSNISGANPQLKRASLAEIAIDIANGAQAGSSDAVTLDNKVEVADYFTEAVRATGSAFGGNEIGRASELLGAVDAQADSVSQAKGEIDDMFGGSRQFSGT